MDVVLDRNPAFWDAVADQLAFKGIGVPLPVSLTDLVSHESVFPYRSDHGGYLFCRLDAVGAVFELHALFTPEGWGREASECLKRSLNYLFADGAGVVVVGEDIRNWRSRPPKSFGFEAVGAIQNTINGTFKTHVLTRSSWERSPARRRMCRS